MTKRQWTRDEPDSPCLRICVIHPSAGICIGCHRTKDEVANWGRYNKKKRLRLLSELPARIKLLRQRRGGRRGRSAT